MKTLAVLAIAGALLFSSGCWPRKKKPVTPPPPAPAAQPPATPAPAAVTAPAQVPVPAETPAPAAPKPRPARTPRPAPPQPAPGEHTTPPAAAPVPQLGAMIPADQRRQLDAVYEADLKRARAVLASLGTGPLDATRAEMATRVRTFIRQAEEYHPRDLTGAAELARRAKLLAEELAARSK